MRDEMIARVKDGLVSTAIAALAVATAASVLVLGQPADQAGRKLHEVPIRVSAGQALAPTPQPTDASSAGGTVVEPDLPAVPVGSDAAGSAPAPTGPAASDSVPSGSAASAGSAPSGSSAAPPTTPVAPPSPGSASPPTAPSGPVVVEPAPAQTVPPSDNGKHKGAGKGRTP